MLMTAGPRPAAALAAFAQTLRHVADHCARAGVFGDITIQSDRLEANALNAAAPAAYRLFQDAGKTWVSIVTPDRWLSHSIEADLLHTGDKLDELLEEELIEQNWTGPLRLPFEHFRDEDKLFTFRTPLPPNLAEIGAGDPGVALTKALLAYEATFRRLGDIDKGGAEE